MPHARASARASFHLIFHLQRFLLLFMISKQEIDSNVYFSEPFVESVPQIYLLSTVVFIGVDKTIDPYAPQLLFTFSMSMFGAIIGVANFFRSGPFCIIKNYFGFFLMMLNIAAYFAGQGFGFGQVFAGKWREHLETADPAIVRDIFIKNNLLYLSLQVLPKALFVSILMFIKILACTYILH